MLVTGVVLVMMAVQAFTSEWIKLRPYRRFETEKAIKPPLYTITQYIRQSTFVKCTFNTTEHGYHGFRFDEESGSCIILRKSSNTVTNTKAFWKMRVTETVSLGLSPADSGND